MDIITRIPDGFGPKEYFRKGDVIHVPVMETLSIMDWSDGLIPSVAPVREKIYMYIPSKPLVVIV